MSRSPRTPAGLGPAGRKLFRSIADDVNPALELDARDVDILARAAVIADLVEVLRHDLAERGALVEGSTGRMMPNPALAQIPRMQVQIARLVEKIQLEPEAAKTGQVGV